MRWPWIRRDTYEKLVGAYVAMSKLYGMADNRCMDLERALDIANALKREEQWRRIKAEGLCQYKDDRIKRVLGLPIWPSEEKKTA